jgi:hypothetical protein
MPGSPPNVQTGLLRNSVGTKAVGPAHHRMIVSARYARIHEFGGTITPLRAKALPVPLNFAAQVVLQRSGGNLRAAMPDGVVIPRKGGKPPLLVGRSKVKTQRGYSGKKRVIDNARPAFLLVKRVNMPKRPFVRPVLERRQADFIAAAKAGVASVLKGAG